MNLSPSNRMTPWVGRLIIANAVVLLLLMTVFTSPDAAGGARASLPARRCSRPWTFVTYMFVHAGLLHLLGNMLMLFVFGTAVEHRMGGRAFLLYYLYLRHRRGGLRACPLRLHGRSGPVRRRVGRGAGRGRRVRDVLARRRAAGVSRSPCRSRRGPSSWSWSASM